MNLYFSSPNAVIRYNIFQDSFTDGSGNGGTAVIALTYSDGARIYGNIFNNFLCGDACIGFDGDRENNALIYNNTIVNGQSPGQCGVVFGAGAGNCAYNNLWVNNAGGVNWRNVTHDYNAFSGSNGNGEPHAQTGVTTAIFLNCGGKDFRLAYDTADGFRLQPPYNVDMVGRIRGADGIWDRGAYDYDRSTTNPIVWISPALLNFGWILTNTTRDLSFRVENKGGGILAGCASVTAPFCIVGTSTYDLGANQSQTLSVRYVPVTASTNSQTVTFSGGGGAAAKVTGVGGL